VLEVRPPVKLDKGAGIRNFLADTEVDAALYVGDDTTDLDAFRALTELVSEGTLTNAIRVGVRSEEAPPEIAAEADLVVDGTDGVRALLALLIADD
jgi:trehalose 6-phosphate phosphatase